MSNRSDRTETITDAQFKQIESKLGCKLPPESREHIRSGITWAPLLQRMQTDLKATIFQVADEIAAHAPALERALAKAQESEDISHWLLDFGGVDHGLAQLGIRPKSCIPFTAHRRVVWVISASHGRSGNVIHMLPETHSFVPTWWPILRRAEQRSRMAR
jgi:hypothetical protein